MTLQRQPRWSGLLLTGLAHLAVLYLLLQSQRIADAPRAARDRIQWLLPMPKVEMPNKQQIAPRRKKAPPTERKQRAATPVPIATATASGSPGTPAPAATPYDPFAQTQAEQPPRSTDNMLARARRDAGKIDKELRKTFPIAEALPPPDSKQARLQRGVDAAHEAVPPKWYQAARMVELTTADGEIKTRTYKITTALLTYCINIFPDGRKSYTECPR